MIEEDYPFSCPHCGVDLSARVEPGSGKEQQFIQDCEVCCKPIQIQVRFQGDEIVHFEARADE